MKQWRAARRRRRRYALAAPLGIFAATPPAARYGEPGPLVTGRVSGAGNAGGRVGSGSSGGTISGSGDDIGGLVWKQSCHI